jgi:hypothetical protein
MMVVTQKEAGGFALINDETLISTRRCQFGIGWQWINGLRSILVVVSCFFSYGIPLLLLSCWLPLQFSICWPSYLYNTLYIGISS